MDNVQLSHEQKIKVIEALQVADRLQLQLDDMQACGEDCQARRLKLETVRRNLQNMLDKFGNQ